VEKDNKLIRSLLFDARQGNNSAFEQLFLMNAGHIYTLALRLSSSLILAEKITKDVFFETWLHISSVRVDTSFNGWLIGITVFRILELFRTGDLINIPKIKPNENIPEIDKLSETYRNIEYAVLTSLTDEERLAFVLHLFERYSLQETADLLGITSNNMQPLFDSAVIKIINEIRFKYEPEKFIQLINNIDYKLKPHVDIWTQISGEIKHYKSVNQSNRSVEMEKQRVADAEDYEKDKQLLREELEKEKKKLLVQHQRHKKGTRNTHIYQALAILFIISIIIAAYYYFSAQNNWDVSSVSGTPKINSISLNDTKSVNKGALLINNSVSEASLYISNVGTIFVKSNSKIKRVENDELFLLQGMISVMRTQAEKFFTVKTSTVSVKDYYLNGDYELKIDANGNGSIQCDFSWIILSRDKTEVIVPANYKCEWNKSNSNWIGLPYSLSASVELKKAIVSFDPLIEDELLFEKIISLCKKSDAVTLWNLLIVTKPDLRIICINKLNELIPFPSGVNQDGLLDLNSKMLQLYLNEIEFHY